MFGENDPGVPVNGIQTVTTTKKGFVPKLPGNTTTFFRGDGLFAQVAYANVTGTPPIDATTGLPTSITFLNNSSSAVTPTGSGNWCSGSATITLTPGTWLVNGLFILGNNGSSANAGTSGYVVAIADGANTGTEPTGVSTSGTITLKAGTPDPVRAVTNSPIFLNNSGNGITLAIEPLLIAVSANNSIFLVPMTHDNGSGIGNARIITNLWALKVSTATS